MNYINHCLRCYDPLFMIIDQIKCLPKPIYNNNSIEETIRRRSYIIFITYHRPTKKQAGISMVYICNDGVPKTILIMNYIHIYTYDSYNSYPIWYLETIIHI